MKSIQFGSALSFLSFVAEVKREFSNLAQDLSEPSHLQAWSLPHFRQCSCVQSSYCTWALPCTSASWIRWLLLWASLYRTRWWTSVNVTSGSNSRPGLHSCLSWHSCGYGKDHTRAGTAKNTPLRTQLWCRHGQKSPFASLSCGRLLPVGKHLPSAHPASPLGGTTGVTTALEATWSLLKSRKHR